MTTLPHSAEPIPLEEAQDKLEKVRQDAERFFSRPGASKPVASKVSGCRIKADTRLTDFIYEVVFSHLSSLPAEGNMNLDEARGLIFTLSDFKAAVDRVAYSEDLLTRAVSLLEGVTRCRLCGSNNTTLSVRQMHSSDEAPTMMLYCGSCHHRTNQTGE